MSNSKVIQANDHISAVRLYLEPSMTYGLRYCLVWIYVAKWWCSQQALPKSAILTLMFSVNPLSVLSKDSLCLKLTKSSLTDFLGLFDPSLLWVTFFSFFGFFTFPVADAPDSSYFFFCFSYLRFWASAFWALNNYNYLSLSYYSFFIFFFKVFLKLCDSVSANFSFSSSILNSSISSSYGTSSSASES